MTNLPPDVQATLRAQAEVDKCKAEEWHRDGRGLWAMRHCRSVGKHGHHEFTSWAYNDPAMIARLEAENARLASDVERLLDHLDKAREAIANAQGWAEKWKAHAFRLKAEKEARAAAARQETPHE